MPYTHTHVHTHTQTNDIQTAQRYSQIETCVFHFSYILYPLDRLVKWANLNPIQNPVDSVSSVGCWSPGVCKSVSKPTAQGEGKIKEGTMLGTFWKGRKPCSFWSHHRHSHSVATESIPCVRTSEPSSEAPEGQEDNGEHSHLATSGTPCCSAQYHVP